MLNNPVSEKIESIVYNPGCQDTGDLEAGTKNITATSEASGLASADYSAALTLAKPSDTRLTVKRIAARIKAHVDNYSGCSTYYLRVYVDAQDAAHRLFDVSHAVGSDDLWAVDTHSGALSTIFNGLKNGTEHTFYFFFWVDAGTGQISIVELWEAVGTCSVGNSGGDVKNCLELSHAGLAAIMDYPTKVGTGTPSHKIVPQGAGAWRDMFTSPCPCAVLSGTTEFRFYGTVATDINYLVDVFLILRSEL